jgi:phage baseplate assembly protein V
MERILQSIQHRVMLTVGRAVIRKINDDPKLQSVQAELLKGELRDNLERFQQYGFTSVPHPGAEGVAVFVGGNRDHGLLVCVDDRRYRLKGMQGGEVALYTDEGDKVHLKRNREIEVITQTLKITCETATVEASEKVTIDTPETEITGNLIVGGNVNTGGNSTSSGNVSDMNGSMQEMRTTYNGHKHTETGSITQTPDAPMT